MRTEVEHGTFIIKTITFVFMIKISTLSDHHHVYKNPDISKNLKKPTRKKIVVVGREVISGGRGDVQ
jgi:hypothetical protein